MSIYQDINDELGHATQGHDIVHDSSHTAFDWKDYRDEYQRRALYYYTMGQSDRYRENMIKVAGLCISELTAFDLSRQVRQQQSEQLRLPLEG